MPSLAPTRLSLNGRVILCLLVTVWAAGALLHIRITRARADREQNQATQKVSPGARAIAPFVPAGTTYHWSPPVASLADWTIPTNWTPSRLTPAADDILVIDPGFTPTLINVPSQTIGALVVTANTDAKLQAGNNANTLTISGSGLQIDSGSSMTLDGINSLMISVAPGSLASISGNLVFQGAAHRLLGSETATDTAGISFQSGSIFTTSTSFTGNPFGAGIGGDGVDQSVRFRDGSAAFFNEGTSPFGTSGANVCSFTFGSAETFGSASAFSYDGRTYGSLTLDGAQTYAGGLSSNGLTVGGDLTIATGSTLSLSTTSGADLTLWGDLTVDGFLNPNGRTVKFQSSTSPALGKATQTIKTAATFDGVNITKASGSLKLAGNVTINGALTFAGTSSAVDVLELNQKTLSLNGTFSDTSGSSANGLKGDATAATPGAILNIGGTGALGTLKFVSGAQVLKSLTVNRTSSGTLTLGTNLTIGNASVGSLTLTNGTVNVGGNTLSLASFPTITRTNGYVIGNLQKTFASTGNFTFTVGTANGYSPVDANVTAGAGNSLTIQAVQGKQPNFYTSNALQRYWRMSTSSSVTANFTFNYLAADVVGTEANYKILKFIPIGAFTQFTPTILNTTSHFATLNGASVTEVPNNFSDWTLGDPTLTVNTTEDGTAGACTALGTGNGCTLREAINAANQYGDPNTINFAIPNSDPGCSAGVCTIVLSTALNDLNTPISLAGTDPNGLIVKRSPMVGTPNFRIFTINFSLTISISGMTITNGRSIDGTPAPTFGNAGAGGGAIFNNNGNLTLSNLIVTGNRTGNGAVPSSTGSDGVGFGGPGGAGGGIYSSNGTVTMTNVTVSNNTTGDGASAYYGGSGGPGGGIYLNSGTLTMTNCIVSGNTTAYGAIGTSGGASSGSGGYGGGIYLSTGTTTILGSTISNNTTGGTQVAGPSNSGSGGGGGGLFMSSGTLTPVTATIVNSTISGNHTGDGIGFGQGGFGGGLYNGSYGTLTVAGTTISGNSTGGNSSGEGGVGGGIASGGTLDITNSTISGNTATLQSGGGIWDATALTIKNCTVTLNSAAFGGAGIHTYNSSSAVTITNTIVAGNSLTGSPNGPDVSSGPAYNSQGFNLIGNADGSSGFNQPGDRVGTGANPLNALLATLANNGGTTMTHALLPGSPAINSGSNANVPGGVHFDQRGVDRFINGTVDIGAFESRGFSISASSGTPQTTMILTSFASPLVATVSSAFSEPVAGGVVTFTAPDPNAGPSATFPGPASTATATINGSGAATSPALTANTSAGSYSVVASIGSGLPTASFALTNKASTLTQVSSSVNPSLQGQNVTFTATVSTAGGTPTGTVQFKDGATNLGAPQALDGSFPPKATISTPSLTPGTHTITAEYSGDANFNPSSGTLSGGQVVNQPSLSINDVSTNEGDSGTKSLTFTVTLSAPSNVTVTANYATADNTATAPSDYVAKTGTLTFNPGDTTQTIAVTINGDQAFESNETLLVNLSNPGNATISDNQGVGTIVNDDAQGGIISFSQSNYVVNESAGSVTITVNRGGDTSGAASVDYSTPDDSEAASVAPCSQTDSIARPRCDFTTAVGTLQFAAGETSKTFAVLISQDNFVEGSEALQLTLSNLTGGAAFGTNSTAVLTINDDDALPSTINPIDDPENFVRQHYHDFLNREPDAAGLDFWKHQITDCGGDPQCIEVKRINVSGAFYLSIEFQGTGYLVERMYKAAYGDVAASSSFGGAHQVQVPVVRFNEFLRDTQKIGQGVIVGAPGWENQLETNKNSFAADFVKRSRFSSAYPTSLSPTDFVNQLFAKTGVTPAPAESQSAIDEFAGAPDTTNLAARGRALRKVAENPAFNQAEFNRAFVLMQYFGYLRRNPNAEASADYTGYDFWLTKLNQFGGNFQNAEMVKAFISADEYRHRFGP